MPQILIYGDSDDCVEVRGPELHADEYDWYDGCPWQGVITAPGDGGMLRVTAWWSTAGTWTIGAGPVDDQRPFPDWPIRYVTGGDVPDDIPAYSAGLLIEVPRGAVLRPVVGATAT